ncbi:Phosphopantetheine attachment site [Streptomyces sp. TLI_053]|uniref:type I polyketide synthase n=1 Tax=Streptomyces sp. TLI_053 TaxID=1855352 RepID=UPI00087AF3DD|nr:beta-ketoacyl synthase N-terminal-like domain-containing protein [Streptomyces sp. TLI_053]SDT83033.1 Phosphopantetheine attachment site [Streptomyces sp. TLI_053]
MSIHEPPVTRTERILAEIWCEVLELDEVGVLDNFFEVGGYSMLMQLVRAQIAERTGVRPTLPELFIHSTIRSCAAFLDGSPAEGSAAGSSAKDGAGKGGAATAGTTDRWDNGPSTDGSSDRDTAREAVRDTDIAVIGLACRFPDAVDVDRFWDNLVSGVDSISRFPPKSIPGPGGGKREYVPARGLLREPEWFDAGYFGYTPREALLTDPQHRVLLECAVEAIEGAGYDPDRFPGLIGVYAGCSLSSYTETLRAAQREDRSITTWDILMGTTGDYLASRIAYKLGLRGPTANVQAACATSLYAVHFAARALLAGECDLALAGGSSVRLPAELDNYRVGGITSPSGVCSPFDTAADGVVGGQGCGITVLKRLAEAVADGDHIHAVLRGSAVNNDGRDRAGFTAPGVRGQVEVVRAAQRAAGVTPSSVTYVEAHGTGTRVGDPIEVAGLNQAFDDGQPREEPCLLGSVKGNIGHLDAAAGIAGFVKTVLAVERGTVPPSLHYSVPNPDIDFAAGPFVVATEPTPWAPAGQPRRAGLTARGLGGNNAHIVLEQPPAPPPRAKTGDHQVLVLSAHTPAALDELTARLAGRLADRPDLELRDVAWTLQVGRRLHGYRRFAVVRDRQDALRVLLGGAPERLVGGEHARDGRAVALLVPRQADAEAVRHWQALGLHPDLTLGPDTDDAAIGSALDTPGRVFLDLGVPGAAARLREHPRWTPDHLVVTVTDPLAALGELWLAGLPVDWAAARTGPVRRVPLPGYPFQRQPYLLEAEPTGQPSPSVPEAGPNTERTVSMLFTEMLGLPEVDPEDSFFDLGGDSLVANELVGRLELLLPVRLEARAMYDAPSVREFTALVEEQLRGAAVRGD